MDEFLTVAEIADVLKLNQQTIRNWIDAGKLPAHHLGRRVRIRKSDFEQLVNESYGTDRPSERERASGIWDGNVPPPQVPPHSG